MRDIDLAGGFQAVFLLMADPPGPCGHRDPDRVVVQGAAGQEGFLPPRRRGGWRSGMLICKAGLLSFAGTRGRAPGTRQDYH